MFKQHQEINNIHIKSIEANELKIDYYGEEKILRYSTANELYEVINNEKLAESEKEWVIEKYLQYMNNQSIKITDGLENTDDSNEESEEIEPYDPEKVRYTLKLFSLASLYNYISGYEGSEEATIVMKPEFQRNYVWNNNDKSKLIESILLNIPIPSIYLNETRDGRYLPADGLQRLNAFMEFMSGELKLTGLEYLKEYDGYKYKETTGSKTQSNILPINVRRKIRDYQVTCFVIDKSTPDKVKLDIFKRLNSTGVKLSAQELRNSITTENIRGIYKDLENNEDFNVLVKNSVNTNRFVHHELILRFIGMYLWMVEGKLEYKGNTSTLIDNTLIYMIDNRIDETSKIILNYKKALKKVKLVFGVNAFRKETYNRLGPINTSLYSQLLVNILDFEFDYSFDYSSNRQKFLEYLDSDNELMLAISTGTNNITNILLAKKSILYFLEEIATKSKDKGD